MRDSSARTDIRRERRWPGKREEEDIGHAVDDIPAIELRQRAHDERANTEPQYVQADAQNRDFMHGMQVSRQPRLRERRLEYMELLSVNLGVEVK